MDANYFEYYDVSNSLWHILAAVFFSILSPERNNHVLNPNRKTFLRFLLFDPGTNFNLSMLIKADCCSCPLMEAMLLPLGRMHKCFMKGEYHRPSKEGPVEVVLQA